MSSRGRRWSDQLSGASLLRGELRRPGGQWLRAVYRVADGGDSWGNSQALTASTGDSTHGFAGSDDESVWVSNSLESDYAYLLRSHDGGKSWSQVWTGPNQGPMGVGQNDSSDAGSSLSVLPGGVVVMVAAHDGTVLVSHDGGESFSPHATPASEPLTDLWAGPNGVLLGVGLGGQIVVSSDGGESFSMVPSQVTSDLFDVGGRGRDVWIVGAQGTALHGTLR